jgi:hypothetical protein
MVGIVEHTATSVGVFGGSSSGIRVNEKGMRFLFAATPSPFFVLFFLCLFSDGKQGDSAGGGGSFY